MIGFGGAGAALGNPVAGTGFGYGGSGAGAGGSAATTGNGGPSMIRIFYEGPD